MLKTIKCTCINGIDPLAHGSVTGECPTECRHCNGSGVQWISRSGRIFKWPGGPFDGRLSKDEVDKLWGIGDI